jgi:hypothetical protein
MSPNLGHGAIRRVQSNFAADQVCQSTVEHDFQPSLLVLHRLAGGDVEVNSLGAAPPGQ